MSVDGKALRHASAEESKLRDACEFLLRKRTVKASPNMSVAAATICFFVGFSTLVVFSPTVAKVGPLLNMTSSERSFLVAVPTITGSLMRLPIAVLSMKFGTQALFIVAQSVGSCGLLGLLIVLFTTIDRGIVVPGAYASLVVFGLLAGFSAASFSVGMIHSSFWTRKERQGLAIGVFQGLGSIGSSVFALIIPFMIEGIGLSATYLLWVCLSFSTILIMVFTLRDPPFMQMKRTIERKGGVVANSWSKKFKPEKAALSASVVKDVMAQFPSSELQKESEKFKVSVCRPRTFEWSSVYFSLDDLKTVCTALFRTSSYPNNALLRSVRVVLTRPHVYLCFFLQFFAFGFCYLGLVIWSPTFWIGAFGQTNQIAGVLAFAFSLLGTVARAPGGWIVDNVDPYKLGVVSSLLQFGVLLGMIFSQIFGLSIALLLMNAIGSALAQVCFWKLLTVHEPENLSGAIGVVSIAAIGSAVLTPILGAIVTLYGPARNAEALRVGMSIPASGAFLQIVLFIVLWLCRPQQNQQQKAIALTETELLEGT